MPSHRALRLAFPVVLFWLLVFPARFIWSGWHSGPWDVHTYLWAGQVMAAGDVGVYDLPAGGQAPYLYPPSFAAFWAAIVTLLGDEGALGSWLVLVTTSAFVACLMGWRESGAWAVLATLPALVYVLAHGQVSAMLVVLTMGGLWAFRGGKPVLGGLLIAAAIHLKLYAVVLLPVLWLRGERRALGWTTGWTAVFSILPAIWLGGETHYVYFAYLTRLTRVSPGGMSVGMLLPPPILPAMLFAALTLSYRVPDVDRAARLALTGALLASPRVHPYSFVSLLLLYPLLPTTWRTVASLAVGAALAAMVPFTIEYDWWWVTFLGLGVWTLAATRARGQPTV